MSDEAPPTITVISSEEALRRRPELYIGTRRSILYLVKEFVADAIDEFVAGRAAAISVVVDGATIAAWHDGAGLPVEAGDGQGLAVSGRWTTIRHGGPRDGHVGLSLDHSVGLFIIAALSESCSYDGWHEGERWTQRFQRGKECGAPRVTELGAGRGVSMRFLPDPKIFGAERLNYEALRAFLFETAHLFPGLRAGLDEEVFDAPSGLRALASAWNRSDAAHREAWAARPAFTFRQTLEDCEVEAVALGFGDRTDWYSWVNGSATPGGGSHHRGFAESLAALGWQPSLAMIHVLMRDPTCTARTERELDVPRVADAIRSALSPALAAFCRDHDIA